MVPIYSLNAWVAMIVPAAGIYLDSSREVYESFVIYSFMKYLLNFLQYDTNLQQYIDHKPGPHHIFPLCWLPNCVGGRRFMVRCKHGILQYVVVRPITTLIAFLSQLFDFYGEGNYNPFSGYTYPVLLAINNASQILAMYCLVIFYTGYRHELDPMQPLAKFFSIKLVVFFSFFQSVVIAGLLEVPMIEETFRMLFPDLTDKVSLGRKMQELLICFDMLIASFGHLYAFSYKPFVEDEAEDGDAMRRRLRSSYEEENRNGRSGKSGISCCQALGSILDFSDEKSDVNEHFSHIFSKIRQMFSFGTPSPAIVSSTLNNDWIVYGSTSEPTRTGDNQTTSRITTEQPLINGSLSQPQNYHSVD